VKIGRVLHGPAMLQKHPLCQPVHVSDISNFNMLR
jgi:hypothetical protein